MAGLGRVLVRLKVTVIITGSEVIRYFASAGPVIGSLDVCAGNAGVVVKNSRLTN